jgi:hypothetical protein
MWSFGQVSSHLSLPGCSFSLGASTGKEQNQDEQEVLE